MQSYLLILVQLLLNFFGSDIDQQEYNGAQGCHNPDNCDNAVPFQGVLKINNRGIVSYECYSYYKKHYGNFFIHIGRQSILLFKWPNGLQQTFKIIR